VITEINESIECLVHFKNAKIRPLRFLWRNRSFRVEEVTTEYKIKDGGRVFLTFAVKALGGIYELDCELESLIWRLRRIVA